MQEEFLVLMGEHAGRGGTLLMSSHDLDEVQRLCTRVGIIREGRLAVVEDVAELRGRSMHRVRVRFAGFVPDAAVLQAVPGVEGVDARGAEARFRVTGSIDPVVKALADHELADLEISEPSLEELFVTFYGGAT
jgi:ABC-2 type transport system ATP-binding protein